ncbi:hypothetical protein SD425_28150 (plasmid) [Hymenobacter sp. GOD-10R]|nr:hypothetical protein [Hymenobacter sp. GOD-10R]WRQ31571.1 hypothetical protein SD425_28150 [Hymenobacter sp. GOD-10R]
MLWGTGVLPYASVTAAAEPSYRSSHYRRLFKLRPGYGTRLANLFDSWWQRQPVLPELSGNRRGPNLSLVFLLTTPTGRPASVWSSPARFSNV